MLTIMHSRHRERGLITIIFSLDIRRHSLERGRVNHTIATSENKGFFKTVSFIPSIIPFSMTAKSSSDISFILFCMSFMPSAPIISSISCSLARISASTTPAGWKLNKCFDTTLSPSMIASTISHTARHNIYILLLYQVNLQTKHMCNDPLTPKHICGSLILHHIKCDDSLMIL